MHTNDGARLPAAAAGSAVVSAPRVTPKREMSDAEALTVLGNQFAEGGCCRGLPLRIAKDGTQQFCIGGRLTYVVGIRGEQYERCAGHLTAAVRARGCGPGVNFVVWNDFDALDHRDVADLCHSAAVIAKDGEIARSLMEVC
jgi:hypothetical protein